jgi:putative transposase
MRYVTYRGRKQVAADLKPVYRAVNADAAAEALQAFDQTWGERYPMIAESWRARWEHIIPFLALPAELRRAVYTTNNIENLTRQMRCEASGVRVPLRGQSRVPDRRATACLNCVSLA